MNSFCWRLLDGGVVHRAFYFSSDIDDGHPRHLIQGVNGGIVQTSVNLPLESALWTNSKFVPGSIRSGYSAVSLSFGRPLAHTRPGVEPFRLVSRKNYYLTGLIFFLILCTVGTSSPSLFNIILLFIGLSRVRSRWATCPTHMNLCSFSPCQVWVVLSYVIKVHLWALASKRSERTMFAYIFYVQDAIQNIPTALNNFGVCMNLIHPWCSPDWNSNLATDHHDQCTLNHGWFLDNGESGRYAPRFSDRFQKVGLLSLSPFSILTEYSQDRTALSKNWFVVYRLHSCSFTKADPVDQIIFVVNTGA